MFAWSAEARSPLRACPDPASANQCRHDRRQRPGQRREQERNGNADRESSKCCLFALPRNRPSFPPQPDVNAEFRMVEKPLLQRLVAARKTERSKNEKRHRRQERQNRTDPAQPERDKSGNQINYPRQRKLRMAAVRTEKRYTRSNSFSWRRNPFPGEWCARNDSNVRPSDS